MLVRFNQHLESLRLVFVSHLFGRFGSLVIQNAVV